MSGVVIGLCTTRLTSRPVEGTTVLPNWERLLLSKLHVPIPAEAEFLSLSNNALSPSLWLLIRRLSPFPARARILVQTEVCDLEIQISQL